VTRAAHTAAGAVLVEVLAAMTLFAIAGSVVSAAALANLRALRTATTLEYLVTIASRELSIAQAKGALPTADDTTLDDPGLGTVRRQLLVTREPDDLATLVVTVAATASPTVTVKTRMLVSP
jgi:type II secretory pathway pseudopilin PulG